MDARASELEVRPPTSPPGRWRSADAPASSASGPRDPAGRLLAEELAARGVELAGPEVESGTGTVVSVATPNGARTMLSDRGVSTTFAPDGARPDLARRAASGSTFRATASCARRSARRRSPLPSSGVRISVDLSSTAAVEEVGVEPFRQTVESLAPDVVFANEAEAELLGSLDRADGRRQARRAWERRPDRRGRRGAARRSTSRSWTRPARATRSRPASCWAGRSSPSTPPPAAWPRWERCPTMADLIRIHPEVRAALEARRPVVALETTLVSHGFPSGEGGAVAAEAERRVRAAWAVPATIGVIDGVIQVGLEEEQLGALRGHARRPQGRPARPRRVRGPGRSRRDDRGRRRSRSAVPSASASSARAGSVAFTGAGMSGPTSRPTSVSSRARRRSSSPPARSRSSTSRRPPSCSRRSACRCSAGERTRCRSSTHATVGRRSPRAC